MTRSQIELKIVSNLQTFGYENITISDIYISYVLARFALNMVKDALNNEENEDIIETLKGIKIDLEKVSI